MLVDFGGMLDLLGIGRLWKTLLEVKGRREPYTSIIQLINNDYLNSNFHSIQLSIQPRALLYRF